MRVKFLKEIITVDWVDDNNNGGDMIYHRNSIIEALEVIPISSTFSNILLPNKTFLLDLRNDWFEQVIE
jgi:hypothetical protein